ncbi:hypothetical protein [Arthrobacter sp. efr-133-TYG-120]|uniref:hypothetical protein n=1 Tax=Arthrobacter sp. efr-133-TYG-120 TaxID=3040280 RepID=UPI00254D82C4|nr:hypothetical protein [Arthrobacter sp. efr-133-TYG-120]
MTVANTVGASDAICTALVLALRSGLDYADAPAAANALGAGAMGDPSSQPHLVHNIERVGSVSGRPR